MVLLPRSACACAKLGAEPPLVIDLDARLREQRAKLSRNNDTTRAINYCVYRWDAFTRFLDDWAPVHVEQRRRTRAMGGRRSKNKQDLRRLR